MARWITHFPFVFDLLCAGRWDVRVSGESAASRTAQAAFAGWANTSCVLSIGVYYRKMFTIRSSVLTEKSVTLGCKFFSVSRQPIYLRQHQGSLSSFTTTML